MPSRYKRGGLDVLTGTRRLHNTPRAPLATGSGALWLVGAKPHSWGAHEFLPDLAQPCSFCHASLLSCVGRKGKEKGTWSDAPLLSSSTSGSLPDVQNETLLAGGSCMPGESQIHSCNRMRRLSSFWQPCST